MSSRLSTRLLAWMTFLATLMPYPSPRATVRARDERGSAEAIAFVIIVIVGVGIAYTASDSVRGFFNGVLGQLGSLG